MNAQECTKLIYIIRDNSLAGQALPKNKACSVPMSFFSASQNYELLQFYSKIEIQKNSRDLFGSDFFRCINRLQWKLITLGCAWHRCNFIRPYLIFRCIPPARGDFHPEKKRRLEACITNRRNTLLTEDSSVNITGPIRPTKHLTWPFVTRQCFTGIFRWKTIIEPCVITYAGSANLIPLAGACNRKTIMILLRSSSGSASSVPRSKPCDVKLLEKN